MKNERNIINLKALCVDLSVSYMKVYNNIRIPTQDTLTDQDKIDILEELEKGVQEFKDKIK